MTHPPASLERLDHLLAELVEVYEAVYVRGPLSSALGEDEDVTEAQLRTLRFLGAHHPEGAALPQGAWVGDVASGLGISYPAATKAVDRLCERGLAERFRDDDDARRIRVGLTGRGQAVLSEVAALRLERLHRALEGVDAGALALLLERLIRASRG